MSPIEPAELVRELGYTYEHRPGKVVRDYLRKKYPEDPKYQRWLLDEARFGTSAQVSVEITAEEIGPFLTEIESQLAGPSNFNLPRSMLLTKVSEIAELDEQLCY